MKAIFWLTCLGVLALARAQPAPAEDSVELQPLIDKVLNAYGGETKLKGLQAFVEKTKMAAPQGPTARLVRYVQLPDQTRLESEFELQGKQVKCRIVYAGDNGEAHRRPAHGAPVFPFHGQEGAPQVRRPPGLAAVEGPGLCARPLTRHEGR
jgi:hypothetical protein